MSWLHYAKVLYLPETLDSRLAASSKGPLKSSEDATSIAATKLPAQQVLAKQDRASGSEVQPSRWRTPEYYFYMFIFLVMVPLMVNAIYQISKADSPHYSNFSHLLSDGWIFGRKVDNSDAQYANFRENIPYIAVVLVLHPLLRRLYEAVQTSSNASVDERSVTSAADARLERRISFDIGFAVIFTIALHGVSAIKVFLILYTNYQIATKLPRSYVIPATWVFNVGILFANELCHGYPLAGVAALLLPPQTSAAGQAGDGHNWGAWIDGYGGLIPRWEILFNFVVLRSISFNCDYVWSSKLEGSSALEV